MLSEALPARQDRPTLTRAEQAPPPAEHFLSGGNGFVA
jgi:hypothetical protein